LTLQLLLVEDSYGVEFHNVLLRMILGKHSLRVDRLPARECNPAIVRKIRGMLLDGDVSKAKIVVVVDAENQDRNVVRERILMHFRSRYPPHEHQVRVVTVNPRHESWLCIGLGLERGKCRQIPEDIIVRERRLKSYEKRYLAQLARYIDTSKLGSEEDFKEYLKALEWLTKDP